MIVCVFWIWCFTKIILNISPSSLREKAAHIQPFMNMLQIASFTGKLPKVVNIIPTFEAHVLDALEMLALVLILLTVSQCCERCIQRLRATRVSNKNLTNSVLDFFLGMIKEICVEFIQAVSLVGSLSQSAFHTVFGEECGRTGSLHAVTRVSFVATNSSLRF